MILDCGLGIAGYQALLIIAAILLTLLKGYSISKNSSILTGIPLSISLLVLFNSPIRFNPLYRSYVDITLGIVYYVALLAIIDTLFHKKSFYPAIILLTTIPLLKYNGLYLIISMALISCFFIFPFANTSKNSQVYFR